MSGVGTSLIYPTLTIQSFDIALTANAGNWDIFQVGNADCYIKSMGFYVPVGGGWSTFTNFTVKSNNTSAVTFLAATTPATATSDKILTTFTTPTLLASGFKCIGTLVGSLGAGALRITVEYYAGSSTLTFLGGPISP